MIAINKMDHPTAKTMLNEVRSILALDRNREWRPPIVLTEAVRGENVPELWGKIEEHRAFLESNGLLEERRRKNDAIAQMSVPASEVLVVDNAPSSDATERLVREHYPGVRYVLEPRPGLDWARNRAIAEARSEIIAFTDDDVIVDRNWVSAIAELLPARPTCTS